MPAPRIAARVLVWLAVLLTVAATCAASLLLYPGALLRMASRKPSDPVSDFAVLVETLMAGAMAVFEVSSFLERRLGHPGRAAESARELEDWRRHAPLVAGIMGLFMALVEGLSGRWVAAALQGAVGGTLFVIGWKRRRYHLGADKEDLK